LSRTDNEYDLILFALPDSLTLVSGASQLRLESYLFTRESIQEAYDHLSPDGVFAMYNYYREDWLINRLAGTVEEVFGHAPCIDRFTAVQSLAVMAIGKSPENAVCDDTWERAAIAASGQEIPAPSADDRPFLYLKDASIPQIYLLLIGLILAVSLIAIRVVGGPLRQMRGYADLFLMGMAFLLLETRSITTFALLFGTTWLVNALVFAGVLLAARPRLVVYNITPEQLRPLVAEVVTTLDPTARWAGETVALPGRGIQVHLDGRGGMRSVSLVALGGRTSAEGWAEFSRRLRQAIRGLRVRTSPWAVVFGGCGCGLLAAAAVLALLPVFQARAATPAPSPPPASGVRHAPACRSLAA